MITPYEIENKEFGKSVRGYNIEEVDVFLDEIMLDYEKLIAENKKLKQDVVDLKADLESYKKSENSVLNTLESAKHLMSDISASAEKRAEIILKNARLDAESIQREAKDSIGRLSEEGEALKKKVDRYRARYRQLLEDELNELDGSSASLFDDLEKDFYPASLSNSYDGYTAVKETVEPIQSKTIEPEPVMKESDSVMSQPEAATVESDVKVREKAGKSALDMLKEDFANSNLDENFKTRIVGSKEDLTKTRIL